MTYAADVTLPHQQLDRYLRTGMHKVSGWLDSRSAEIVAALGLYQSSVGTRGSVGEIGVHHGKLFILLDLLRHPGEKSFAVDLFDNQDENVDASGFGDFKRFTENLERHSLGAHSVVMFKQNSLRLEPEEVLKACGPVRFLSVDGGHTAECTLNDLLVADAVLTDGGIVVIDDYFNAMWPDVSVGVGQYMADPASRLRAFAISPNKLFLAEPMHHERYRGMLRQRNARYYQKESVMFGHGVDIFGYDASTSRRRNVVNSIKRSPIGPLATELYRRYRGKPQETGAAQR
jgi:hypothetical protein